MWFQGYTVQRRLSPHDSITHSPRSRNRKHRGRVAEGRKSRGFRASWIGCSVMTGANLSGPMPCLKSRLNIFRYSRNQPVCSTWEQDHYCHWTVHFSFRASRRTYLSRAKSVSCCCSFPAGGWSRRSTSLFVIILIMQTSQGCPVRADGYASQLRSESSGEGFLKLMDCRTSRKRSY